MSESGNFEDFERCAEEIGRPLVGESEPMVGEEVDTDCFDVSALGWAAFDATPIGDLIDPDFLDGIPDDFEGDDRAEE